MASEANFSSLSPILDLRNESNKANLVFRSFEISSLSLIAIVLYIYSGIAQYMYPEGNFSSLSPISDVKIQTLIAISFIKFY
jgi:hypothetical protein